MKVKLCIKLLTVGFGLLFVTACVVPPPRPYLRPRPVKPRGPVVVRPPMPPKPSVVRPKAPGRHYVWIAGRWHWNGKKWVWKKGYWKTGRGKAKGRGH